MLEQLEDRQVPSSTGVISSITDGRGLTTAFTVGMGGGVFAATNGAWNRMSFGGDSFTQVSAGLWNGMPVCFAIAAGSGNLCEFYFSNGYWYGENWGGQCYQISATVNNECYVIGMDHSVWLHQNNGWWNEVSTVAGQGGPAVQISAGVDQWGQDKVYVEVQGGWVYQQNHDGSYRWLPFNAAQLSAGIGTNSTGTDLYYLSASDRSLHYYNGSTDTNLGGWCLQISAGLDPYGQAECFVIGGDHHQWLRNASGWWDNGGQWTQISGAQDDMCFGVGPVGAYNTAIWAYDPHHDWWQDRFLQSGGGLNSATYFGDWFWTGGASANPNTVL
jgi:hypothetical protein